MSERPQRERIAWRRIDGVLLLDKPVGVSSNRALQVVRRKLAAARGGHTGTLDPLASGLLPLAFGEATKFSQGLLDADKSYRTTVRLGERTATGDAEGEVLERRAVSVDLAAVIAMLDRFRGAIEQVPPMYSALKRDGVPLYRLARRGETAERAPRRVVIHQLELIEAVLPELTLDIRCSKGTYVRQLGEDLGEALGCGAHLRALRRTAVGPHRVEDAHTLESVEAAEAATVSDWLLPLDTLLPDLPEQRLDAADAARFAHGQTLIAAGPAGLCKVIESAPNGRFLGLAERDEAGHLRPRRLVSG